MSATAGSATDGEPSRNENNDAITPSKPRGWRRLWKPTDRAASSSNNSFDEEAGKPALPKWSLGILNDKQTEEVPGSILLLDSSNRNEPLGLQNQPARTSASSLPSPFPPLSRPGSIRSVSSAPKKKTKDGVVLNPQPEESPNDPLNWPAWRRDAALGSLGLFCMVGGGMTPILAAGFNDVSETFDVTTQKVAFTTGLYMLGLGIGSVIASPTAILFGKRPIYLIGAILFILSSVWCALSPDYGQLVAARIFQGIAVSPVECLPSATIAEIFFLHERAYRVGIYTLLLLGGKNLVPLVSAAIIEDLGWRWVFWMVAIVVGFCGSLLFFFVPETFWDRTPRPKKRPTMGHRTLSNIITHTLHHGRPARAAHENEKADQEAPPAQRRHKNVHVGFADGEHVEGEHGRTGTEDEKVDGEGKQKDTENEESENEPQTPSEIPTPRFESTNTDYLTPSHVESGEATPSTTVDRELGMQRTITPDVEYLPKGPQRYTTNLRRRPQMSFMETLNPWNGRIHHGNWFKVLLRPFVLFAYPSVLWSTLVYSLSVGWLIVLSESVAHIYENKESYNFSSMGTGLVYLSPFIGGILGTAVAGKVSDVVVRFMTRRNGGIYEPEFRLIMALPVALSTAAGLMGFGWSAEERDTWIVPTIFFGIISFGCSLGSTTSITFCVDSYRQYAGEALVTLNFCKNIFHGLVFSLFFVDWLDADGSKEVFLIIGGIQLACLVTTIPMYIYGKRARMWTVRKNLMEKF